MRFEPKTEQQLEAEANENLLPAGIYDFEVLRAREKMSKKDKPMIEVEVEVFHDGGSVVVRDYLMEAMQFKLLHFCEAGGLEAKYAAGTLTDDDCAGVTGKCKIRIEKGRAKENGDGFFRDKNSIQDYVKPGATASASKPNSQRVEDLNAEPLPWEREPGEDDIPL